MDLSSLPLTDELDHEILMHKEVHFSGSFPDMIEYYENEGKGVQDHFDLFRIQELALIEREVGYSLAEELLQDREQELVAKAKEKYLLLRELYECDEASPVALAVADLIISEEESPDEEIEALLALGKDAVPALLELIEADEFASPLLPGYGLAPLYAAEVLGKLGDERAILPLFQGARGHDFEREATFFAALARLPSQEFLLRKLSHFPLTRDHQIAADALANFPPNEEIGKVALTLLHEEAVRKEPTLSFALILLCEGLKSPAEREKFALLAQGTLFPPYLREEIKKTLSITG